MKEWVKITDIIRLQNTPVGCPMWKVFCETKDKLYEMKTHRNSFVGYKISTNMIGTGKNIQFHCTRGGKYIMDDIEV